MFIFLLACSETQADSAALCAEADQVEWSYWAEGFFLTYCNGCHSETSLNRYGAPEALNFDSEVEVLKQAELIFDSTLVRQSMPKGGGVEQAELEMLERYLSCWGEVSP